MYSSYPYKDTQSKYTHKTISNETYSFSVLQTFGILYNNSHVQKT